MKPDGLIRDKYPRFHPDQTLRELVSVVSETTTGVIAVLDRDGRFRGMVDVASIHKMLVSVDKYDKVRVYSLMEQAPAIIYSGEKMEDVMSKFDRTGAWRLPVVTDDGTYLGFISRSRVLTAYREELKKISQED
jgi:CIC family chloride channel protein